LVLSALRMQTRLSKPTIPAAGLNQTLWNQPAFLDYVDRWMAEDDPQDVAEIKALSGFDYSADWEHQGQPPAILAARTIPQYSFIDDMWEAYRWHSVRELLAGLPSRANY
jgi:hypothetical protein